MTLGGIILGVLAIFLPPAAVVIRRCCNIDLLINVALLFLGWLPAVLHAWYIIVTYPSLRQRRRRAARERKRSRSVDVYSPRTSAISEDGGYPYLRRRSSSRTRLTARTSSAGRHERLSRSYRRDSMSPGGGAVGYPPVYGKY